MRGASMTLPKETTTGEVICEKCGFLHTNTQPCRVDVAQHMSYTILDLKKIPVAPEGSGNDIVYKFVEGAD